MLTPAQKHFQNVMAKRRGAPDEETGATRTAHEQIMHRLRLAQSRLHGIQSNAVKAEIKKELLPEFTGWIDGTLEGDSGRQDDVITTLMVWAIDCGDIPLALRIGAYVVRHGLTMPDNFGRSAATVLTEEICSPVLTLAATDPDADLSGSTEQLDTLNGIVAESDMPDQVRAKLCKARAFTRRASTDPETQAESLKLLREAMNLDKNAGVKREITTLLRALKKVSGVPADTAKTGGAAATTTAKVASTKPKAAKATKAKAAKGKATKAAAKKPAADGQEQN
ncbi:phage terminase small subunit [Trabulsiella odontotermitis]|uniref:phage terminase small subunit n=1 Tax=Trabulsiella odontotermitis TaxID=379893 RepID=UPI000675DF23|nr:phage terminase small subunit [Trabulsiella odontotermitis]KNC89852.1 terminase [Trabulsiella odontotermitis]